MNDVKMGEGDLGKLSPVISQVPNDVADINGFNVRVGQL
jgi:hypothetical protein